MGEISTNDKGGEHKARPVDDAAVRAHSSERGLDHAWRYFALHAQQRISVFNFFVVVSGILSTGIGAGLQAGARMAPLVAVLGFLLALFSFVFYRLDRRGAELVKLAEKALVAGEEDCVPAYAHIVRLEAQDRESAPPATWTFGRSFRLIFWVMGVAGLTVGLWSFLRVLW